jgi:flagellar motor switch protein FliG
MLKDSSGAKPMSEETNIVLVGGDAERAAVMVMLLEDEQAAQLLGQLEPGELRRLGEKMCELGEISPSAIAEAIAGFVERTERLG